MEKHGAFHLHGNYRYDCLNVECIYCTVMGNVSAIWTHILLLGKWWASIKWMLLLIDCAVTIWKYIKIYLRPVYETETWNERLAKSWEHARHAYNFTFIFQINIYNNVWLCMLKFLDKNDTNASYCIYLQEISQTNSDNTRKKKQWWVQSLFLVNKEKNVELPVQAKVKEPFSLSYW